MGIFIALTFSLAKSTNQWSHSLTLFKIHKEVVDKLIFPFPLWTYTKARHKSADIRVTPHGTIKVLFLNEFEHFSLFTILSHFYNNKDILMFNQIHAM